MTFQQLLKLFYPKSADNSADASPTAPEHDIDWDGLRSEIHASLKKFEVDKFTGTPIELLHCLVVDVIQSFASVKGCLDVEAEKPKKGIAVLADGDGWCEKCGHGSRRVAAARSVVLALLCRRRITYSNAHSPF